MRINRQLMAAITILVLLPVVAFPWASVAPLAETHQYIVQTALSRLEADPAFELNLFPNTEGVELNEGVELTAAGLIGKGADAHTRSTYSEHYYNPVTREGNAPTSVAHYFTELIKDNLINQQKPSEEGGPKAAAYCAHFLADIFVPYHVNGTTRANAEKIWVEQQGYETQQITLPETITGSMVLSYMAPYQGAEYLQRGQNRNFYPELFRFVTLTDPPEFDWFDPWYYNGTSKTYSEYFHSQSIDNPALVTNVSSHILWEGRPSGQLTASAFHQQAGKGMDGYDPHWKNAAPTFDSPWVGQSEQARQFTIFKATETRTRQEFYFNTPTIPLRDAIRAVYTLWRASISGLRPAIEYQPEANSTAYRVTGKVTNAASAAASSLRGRLTATNCTVADKNEKSLGPSLAAGKTQTVSASWQVQPIADKLCKLRLEVVGTYAIPDLQYARVDTLFLPEHREAKTTPTPPKKTTPANSSSSTSSASTPSANTGGGHWERGAPSIEWGNGYAPTDGKTGRKLGDVPHGGDSWISGGDFAHQYSNTVESMGENQYAYHSFALADPKGFDYHYTGSWTLPPPTLTPGQKFTMHVTSGVYGGASCYAWQGKSTNNTHLVEATRGNPSVTSAPYTIPDGGKNAQFGFFCGTSMHNWHYTYHWVGGGAH